jgi:toxin ParE1/3/4
VSRVARFEPAALQDLQDVYRWIAGETHSRSTARQFVAQLRAHCARLANLPATLGRPRDELEVGLRSSPLRDYVIFFRYADAEVVIVRVIHAKRDPPAAMKQEPEG